VGERGMREERVRGDEGVDQEALGKRHEAGSASGYCQRSSESHRRKSQKTKIIFVLFNFAAINLISHFNSAVFF